MAPTMDNPWVRLLRAGDREEFNRRAERERPNLENGDLRLVDARGANLRRANLQGAYLRNADLRGIDLSEADLDGASLNEARISGTLFPRDLDPQEIFLSVWKGTRLRARRQ